MAPPGQPGHSSDSTSLLKALLQFLLPELGPLMRSELSKTTLSKESACELHGLVFDFALTLKGSGSAAGNGLDGSRRHAAVAPLAHLGIASRSEADDDVDDELARVDLEARHRCHP